MRDEHENVVRALESFIIQYREKGKTGMGEIDPKLLEMADVFHIPKSARMKYIILPAKMPGLSKLFNKTGKTKAADSQGQGSRQ